jgi:hypothetical protein
MINSDTAVVQSSRPEGKLNSAWDSGQSTKDNVSILV